jgi:hypothetical protein
MPQRIIAAREVANMRATVRIVSASMPQIGAIASGMNGATLSKFRETAGTVGNLAPATRFLMTVYHRVQQRHVGVGFEL